MMTDTILFTSDGALHVIGLSFLKFFLITIIVLLSLCSFGIQVIKYNGNSVKITVVKSEREVCNCEGRANCWPDPATQCA